MSVRRLADYVGVFVFFGVLLFGPPMLFQLVSHLVGLS